MANIEDLWACFSIMEEEEQGADVPKQGKLCLYQLATKHFTKTVVNAEAIACTFKSLWKPSGELKIRDIGGSLLLFEFEDAVDLERVLEFEPWSYDKSLVVFQCAIDVEFATSLDFASINFWVQLHNIPATSLTQETSEVVGNSFDPIVHVTDSEDDGVGGEVLRISVVIDITNLYFIAANCDLLVSTLVGRFLNMNTCLTFAIGAEG